MLLSLLAVLAASTPAAGPAEATTAAPPSAAATAAPAKKDDLVCRTEEVTGSRFPKKVCRPREQAERETAEQQQQIRQSQRVVTPFRH